MMSGELMSFWLEQDEGVLQKNTARIFNSTS